MVDNMPAQKFSFDDRIVDFKVIHNQTEEDLLRFVEIIDAQPDDIILDGMDGYGAVAKEILESAYLNGFALDMYTLDESSVQIERARKNMPTLSPDHIINADMLATPFGNNMFDKVVIKMGVHEVPKQEQSVLMQEVFRILKPGGKFIVWELSFPDPETQKVFQDLIRAKDMLAGFDTLVERRYFPRQDELLHNFQTAGFQRVSIEHKVNSRLTMRVRESELVSKDRKDLESKKGKLSQEDEKYLTDLGRARCEELVNFSKKYMASVPTPVRDRLSYREVENDIQLIPFKEIIVGFKPL